MSILSKCYVFGGSDSSRGPLGSLLGGERERFDPLRIQFFTFFGGWGRRRCSVCVLHIIICVTITYLISHYT